METTVLRVEDGVVVDAPFAEGRGRCWAATVAVDPDAPGGLRRAFWRAVPARRGYVVPEDLRTGQVVEFACDVEGAAFGGKGRRRRAYCAVVQKAPDRLVVAEAVDAPAAFSLAQEVSAASKGSAASGPSLEEAARAALRAWRAEDPRGVVEAMQALARLLPE